MYEGQSPYLVPVTIVSSQNDQLKDFASRPVTETFTRQFENSPEVSQSLLEEMRQVFSDMDGRFSARECEMCDDGIVDFLKFVVTHGGGINSLEDLTSNDLSLFFSFLQGKKGNWKSGYKSFRPRLKEKVDLDFPVIPWERKITEGFTVEGTAALREALCKEINHARAKIGRFDNAMKTGKVLELPSIKTQRCISDEDVAKVESASRDDMIKTICHYIPRFPLERPVNQKTPMAKVRENEGNYLLYSVCKCAGDHGCTETPILSVVKKMFRGITELVDHYFPTMYDATIFMMYIGVVTGWNIGAIQSVGRDELNMRFKRNRYQGILGKNHVVLRGLKPRSKQHKPKAVTHVSDLNDEYGVYNVLQDFWKLSNPIRTLLALDKKRAIIIAVGRGSTVRCFGPGVKPGDMKRLSSGESRKKNLPKGHKSDKTQAEIFLAKHEIYDEPGVRIESITWRQIRTSFETVIEDMGLPLYVRQKLLGHTSMDTSMLYGSDAKSLKLQMKKLGDILTSIHAELAGAKFFQGAILKAENDPRRRTRGKVEYNAFKDWQDNFIILCGDAKNPTWAGHEMYVKPGKRCTFLGKCLLCKRSLISKATLPHLVSWEMDISDYFDDGEWDTDTQWLVVQNAIREALQLWSDEVSPEDVKAAKAQAKKIGFERISLDIWNVGGLIDDE